MCPDLHVFEGTTAGLSACLFHVGVKQACAVLVGKARLWIVGHKS